tara:strand:+ start:166 stop:906 length:741 start_codon:yes stop_codon:yes gene_type:complete
MKMNGLFKYLTFLILLGVQVYPQNISRLRAKKEREKSKRTMPNVEETVEEISSADSSGINILDEETSDPLTINIVNEMKVDSLAIKKDKKPKKTAKQKVVMPKVKLSINTIPEKVEVSLDGNILGETPLIGKKISPGEHTFQIQKDGYAPISYGLNVNPSKSVSLDFFMNPVYDIKFKTEEVGLIFELNDTHRWTDNTIGMQIEAGNHHLRVYKLGEIIDEQVIIADQPLTFQYYLKRGTVSQPAK